MSTAGIYAGGDFTGADNLPQAHIAAILPATTGVAGSGGQSLELSASSWPNPFGGATRLRYVLPEAAVVTLRIYDMTGREHVRLAGGTWQSAGPHEVPWRADGLAPGVYVARLDAGRRAAFLKMVVAR